MSIVYTKAFVDCSTPSHNLCRYFPITDYPAVKTALVIYGHGTIDNHAVATVVLR